MLQAIPPINGRYADKTKTLVPYFSEEALIRYRVRVEVKCFTALYELPLLRLTDFSKEKYEVPRKLYQNFTIAEIQRVKEVERITNHDVKVVEYFIKEVFDYLQLEKYKEFIHFGLTPQDTNNTAIPLNIKEAMNSVYYTEIQSLINKLQQLVAEWKDIPLPARTHDQSASLTRLGKESQVFATRTEAQLQSLRAVPYAAKLGGATGNYSIHKVAYPSIDWKVFGMHSVEKVLGLHHSFPTTQIEHCGHLAAFFDALKRVNTILIDLNRDIWTYIPMDYFRQKIKAGEVGLSAMPHKVNPTDSEDSEGSLGIANALLEHLAAKLPISRLQHNLTDSTVLRNVGVSFGHTPIALRSTLKGLNKLLLNEVAICSDLQDHWAIAAGAIWTVSRREGHPNPHEALRGLTRTNEAITAETIGHFVDTLEANEAVKAELKQIIPGNYMGVIL